MGQPEPERKNKTRRTGKTERNRQTRKDRMGQAEQDFVMYCFEDNTVCFVMFNSVKNVFGDMFYSETILLCDMYRLRTYRLISYCYVTHSFCNGPLSSCIE
jgi:hypothetical protein